MIWNEYGLTYGKTIMETSNERLNVAGRLKFLQGLGAAFVYIKNINYKLNTTDTSIMVSGKAGFGYSSNLDNKNPVSPFFSKMPSLGLDIGATYEFHKLTDVHTRMASQSKTTPMQHPYKYKIGFSIQDLGWIGYLKSPNSREFNTDSSLVYASSLSASGTNPAAALDKVFGANEGNKKFRMNLPTLVSIQGDYYAGRNIYVNSTMNYAFQFRNNEDKIHEVTTLSITPRWDWKWIGAYAPVSYNKYSHIRAGFSLRLGPLVVGTSDLLPLITKKDVYGLDFHFLLKVPHISFKKKDKHPRSANRFNVNEEKNKKSDRQRGAKPDMPKKDSSNYKQPTPEKRKKIKQENEPVKRERKVRKHIFPRIHLFKKKGRHVSPENREQTIYFKI